MTAMRLQRALARAGVTSRRKAEDLIRAGRVQVDGAPATLGMSVDPLRQRVTVDGRAVRPVATAWLALNKPIGYVVSRGDPAGRKTVFDLLPKVPGLTYVGRLARAVQSALKRPVVIDGRPVDVTGLRVRPGAGRSRGVEIELTLAEGRHRIVRRLAEAVGLKVEWLHRVAYGPVRLGSLPEARYRTLTPREVAVIERDAPPHRHILSHGQRHARR